MYEECQEVSGLIMHSSETLRYAVTRVPGDIQTQLTSLTSWSDVAQILGFRAFINTSKTCRCCQQK
jgi:hypothetical protein